MNKNEFRNYAIKHKGISSLKVDHYLESTSKNYVRTDFRSETIFSDEIDGSFFAD